MPFFEFTIPDSILFLPANLSFISFCFFISFIFYKLFKSKIVFILSISSLLSFAYGDILLKYGIEKYYTQIKYDSGVYSYASKNEDGKIESLSTIKVYKQPLNSLSNLNSKQKEYLVDIHEDYIDKFIDVPLYTYKFNKYKYFKERFYLNIYKYDDSFIEDENAKARYDINIKEKQSFFESIYKDYEYSFVDTKTNQVIANAFYIKFKNDLTKFRNRFLYWDEKKEKSFAFADLENFDNIYKKVFIDDREVLE